MKILLIIVAAVAAMGAVVEAKKGGYIALFVSAVLLYIVLNILGGVG